ncbi:CDP-alcohol phosphatidyltransferase family protein [Georgenia sp. EYE_87]|uniref:CDP-alcohol phosphatidyltransferase family protein n=1 Tax=Georgenia sp. EYE_87 TaxID=2853448 RepID=UPI0020051208|nr:CDP-alcohol phosphatidyltransferase family protein [Georgenia sp. EYE_87]MCK6211718.1 CDP-alcohol phosphatidyltransferase family protein [Georgenia sp. EYE_87]
MTLARTALPAGPWPWPALAAGLAASVAVPVALAAVVGGALVVPAAASVYVVGAAAVAARWPRRELGAANAVTLVRLVLVSWIAGLLALPSPGGWAVPVAVAGLCCLVLDGVDGRVARGRGLAGSFGARFDLEVDAALVLVLSVAVGVLGVAGWWVASIGLVRYAYALAGALWPWLRGPLFPSVARKVVGVCVVVALVVALLWPLLRPLLPGRPADVPTALLVVALGALAWSFGRDARWQYASRRQGAAQPDRTAYTSPGGADGGSARSTATMPSASSQVSSAHRSVSSGEDRNR